MRLYFDECCSKRLARELKEFYAVEYPSLETAHVLDNYNAGTGDSDWLKPLRDQEPWIVITQDHGRDAKKEKLPVICKELGVTHVAFSSAIIDGGYTVHKAALVAVWGWLAELHKLPPGTHARLTVGMAKGGVKRYELRVDGKLVSTILNSN